MYDGLLIGTVIEVNSTKWSKNFDERQHRMGGFLTGTM